MGRPRKDDDEKPSKAVSLTTKLLQETASQYDEAKQKVADAAMKVAGIMKHFDNLGGNNQAFKQARKLANMEEDKARDYLRSFHMYLTEFGVYDQLDMLDELPDFRKAEKTIARPAPSTPSFPAAAAH